MPTGEVMSRILTAVISAGLLASCGPGSADVNTDEAQARKPTTKSIDGYADIKFGESFNDLMGSHRMEFHPYGIQECYKDMPLKGCLLMGREETPPQIRDGIPYELIVRLNQLGKVTDVKLKYEREGVISVSDCRSIHERTLDWLVRDYGNMYEEITPQAAKQFRTPAGNTYLDTGPNKDGNWVSSWLRTGVRGVDVRNTRYVELITTYIIIESGPTCRVSAEFKDAPSVPRPNR
jgi:hypothetical protein